MSAAGRVQPALARLLGRRRRPILRAGHEAQLLKGGAEFFPALECAIDEARDSVRIETYIFHDDDCGRRIAGALARAALRGVRVQLVVDGFGTGMPGGGLAELLAAGPVELRVFRPLPRWRFERQALRRLHRKLALVDVHTVFVGGINLIDDHVDPMRGRLDAPRFDFALRVNGPLVDQVLPSMERVWHRATPVALPTQNAHDPVSARMPAPYPRQDCTPLPAKACPPALSAVVHRAVRAAFVERDNWLDRRTIERAYLRAIGAAREEVLIACAYFFPGAKFRRALIEAAARGVRVRLLLQGRIEYRLPHFGTLALHEELLRSGVEVIEYRLGFLHAKLALADQWLTVGSSNIDPYSLLLAREGNVIARDAALAAQLRQSIEQAIEQGGESVRWSQILDRPWWVRVAALGASLLLRVGVAISGRGLRY